MMIASVLTIGSELTAGYTLDSHSQYISRKLIEWGYQVSYHLSCDDTSSSIADALAFLGERSQLIVTTGGLGPTVDDITRQVVADYLTLPLVINEASRRKLELRFQQYGYTLTDNNYQQAYFPQGADVLANARGSADGFLTQSEHLHILALPGPPREMRHVLELSASRLTIADNQRFSRTIKLYGFGESAVDEKIADIDIPDAVSLGIYAERGIVAIRLSTYHSDSILAQSLLQPPFQAIYARLQPYVYTCDERSLAEVVVAQLADKQLKLSVAESCTGGRLASAITAVAGASAVLKEALVTYSNEAKVDRLAVAPSILEKCGAVSAETAGAMVNGLMTRPNVDLAVAITGIAGPSGGTADKPVGTVFVAIQFRNRLNIEQLSLHGDRSVIQMRTTMRALKMIYDTIVS